MWWMMDVVCMNVDIYENENNTILRLRNETPIAICDTLGEAVDMQYPRRPSQFAQQIDHNTYNHYIVLEVPFKLLGSGPPLY